MFSFVIGDFYQLSFETVFDTLMFPFYCAVSGLVVGRSKLDLTAQLILEMSPDGVLEGIPPI